MAEPTQRWEWGVRLRDRVFDYDDEDAAREALTDGRYEGPGLHPQLVRRLVTVEPWVWVKD